MDRFTEWRFDGAPLDSSLVSASGADADRNDLTFSPIFERVSPLVTRWIADHRGKIIAREVTTGGQFGTDPAGYGWRHIISAGDRRTLLHAALHSAEADADAVTIRIRCADGEWRWCKVRMVRMTGTGGRNRWYGTIEDVHERRGRETRALAEALMESREHHRWSVALSPQVPWTACPDGALEEIGPRFQELTGISPGHDRPVVGWQDVIHPDDTDRTMTRWYECLVTGEPLNIDFRMRMRDGEFRWMRSRGAARRDDQGRIIRWYVTLEDVHAERLAQQALAESEERFRLAVQSAGLGIWDFDGISGVRTWSPELRRMLGVSMDQPATGELALSLVHEEDRAQLKTMLEAVAKGTLPRHFEATLRVHRADTGDMRWIRSMGWITHLDNARPTRLIVTFLDVTKQRIADDRIHWAATHDAMTRLPNRAMLKTRLDDMAKNAGPTGARFGLLLFDIDDLKRINDVMGHDSGDALLCGFAARLSDLAPADAIVGRLGGDEFGLIATSLGDAKAMADCSAQLLKQVGGPYLHNGRSIECGVSVGGALFGEHASSADELFKAADLALYASKASGRSRFSMFHSTLRAEAQQRSSMLGMARQIIADKLITPHYQLQIDMRTGQVLGHEALLRWEHPRLGPQLPGSIAAAFENHEIAVALTEEMLASVVADISAALQQGLNPGRIAINASAGDFMHGDFAERILSQLARFDVPTRHLEVEVTETVFLGRGAGQVADALQRFSDAGITIALDDFGTGYASLSHLKQYPVNVIKIDRSFVRNIEHDAGDAAIVEAIVRLGTSLGMEVVAEGVETQAQAQLLLSLGCTVAQGFLYGRPKPWAQVLQDLR